MTNEATVTDAEAIARWRAYLAARSRPALLRLPPLPLPVLELALRGDSKWRASRALCFAVLDRRRRGARLTAIGAELGVSRERIRAREAKALRLLAVALRRWDRQLLAEGGPQARSEIGIESADRLSVRAKNALLRAGIQTLGQLDALGPDDLLRFTNFGKGSLAEVMAERQAAREEVRG